MKTKTIKKILLFGVIPCLLVFGGGYVGYQAYKSARQARLIAQARHYLAKPNEKKALLCLRRALRYNPKDVEACRLMADLNQRALSPGALLWRSRVVELNPHSLDDRLALAQTALTFRDYASATNALEGVDAAGRKTAAYHDVAGAVALAANQVSQAEAHFLEAARLEPANAIPQLNLARVRLLGTNSQTLAEARTVLTRLSVNPTNSALRCQALRVLVADAMRFQQKEAALTLSRDLLQQTNSGFNDRLLRLTVLNNTRNAEFKPALADFQREAAQGSNAPAKICQLALWQTTRTGPTGPREALAWLSRLPVILQTNQAVALVIAENQITLGYWQALLTALEKQDWADLDFLRHAYKARGLRGQGLTGAAKAEWELALKTAGGQKGRLVMLLRLTDKWKWQSENEELLWSIVNQYPGERWAFQALSQTLIAGGRTRPLMMLFSQESKRNPSDVSVKNNLAMTALLLGANELRPHELARDVYQKDPTNAAYISTYAFSLHLQKKDAEALKLMQQLKPKDLEEPSIAGYYGLILQATGQKEKAKVYLRWASRAQVLPEEKKLFDRAAAGT